MKTRLLATLALATLLPACVTERNPDFADAAAEAALRRAEAIDIAERAYEIHESGRVTGDPARLDRAEELYRESLAKDPSVFATWNNLGELLLSQGEYQLAADAFGEAAFLNTRDPRPAFNRGLTYHRAGYAETALRYYSEALNRDPNYRPALRGATRAAALINAADYTIEEWIRTALMNETDPEWREFFTEQRFRVEAALRDQLYESAN
ncbi:MAG: tetratricopeptide repeat protein [Phycisphaerales bacterium JB040]